MALTAKDIAQEVRLNGSTGRADLVELIETVRDCATRLLYGTPHPPSALRLRVGEVTVELEWPVASAHPVRSDPGPAAPPDRPAAEDPPAPLAVTAPSVGVFYHAPEPGAPPFVAVGDAVTIGQQVGIIEVMKTMIPVAADRSGRVVAVLAENGAAVEYGEPLLALDETSDR